MIGNLYGQDWQAHSFVPISLEPIISRFAQVGQNSIDMLKTAEFEKSLSFHGILSQIPR